MVQTGGGAQTKQASWRLKMSQEGIRKSGYLEKLPVKGLVKKWSRRWFVLYGTSHEGVVRIEYYDSKETASTGVGKRTIPLRDGRELSPAPGNKLHPYVFGFTSQIGHHVLAADSQLELDDWIDKIKRAVQEDRIRRRRTKGQSKVVASDNSDASFESLDDSGTSYKNKVDSGTYRVTVEESATATKMSLSGTYSLELSPSFLTLIAPSGAKIFTLSYKFLKNYGKQSGQFHFETGKNSPIGEGRLIFVTTCSKEVFGVVHNNIKRMRETAAPKDPARKTSAEAGPRQERLQTQPIARPQPFQSVPAPPLPQKKGPSMGNRPTSRHSSEIADNPVVGTYRTSKDLEEVNKASATGPDMIGDVSDLYATVDMSKKRSSKIQQQKKKVKQPPKQPQPYNKAQNRGSKADPDQEEALYAQPYEDDPAFRPPPVPSHQNSFTQDSRASAAFVDLEENAFYDSFEDDDDDDNDDDDGADGSNLEPLAEGASNPLDLLMDFGENPQQQQQLQQQQQQQQQEQQQQQQQEAAAHKLATVDSVDKELDNLDFGFGPGNLSPLPTSPPITNTSLPAASPPVTTLEETPNFEFDFGGDLGEFPARSDDPFNSNLAGIGVGATGNEDFADFDLGQLDANFFEKLEAIEVTEEQSPWPQNPSMDKQQLDQFWSDVDIKLK